MNEGKIVSLDELKKICNKEKGKGKKIVLCHGSFDLLHPGHIRHLTAAKKYGDILVVTIIPDKFIKKGPGRPVFNESLRLESVASLIGVDYVALNTWDTAIKIIKMLKPDFYVKGREYSDRAEGATSVIISEGDVVKDVGGEMRFTEEITFSSSRIINEFLDVLSKKMKEHIKDLKEDFSSEDIINILKKLNDLKVLIIGDVILDEYIFCKAIGKPEKAAVVSTKFLYNELYAGGSAAVANHIAGFAKKIELVSCLGKDNWAKEIERKLKKNVDTKFFYRKDAPTIIKTRYVAMPGKTKLYEVSHLKDESIGKDLEDEIVKYLKNTVAKYDMVIIADFGHGLITPKIQETIIKKAKFTAVNAQTNSANFGFNLITKYKDIDYISIDENELRLPYRTKFGEIEPLIKEVVNDTQCKRVNITLGDWAYLHQNGKTYFVPIFSENAVDSLGAGDAVLSITSMLVRKDIPPKLIPFIGNAVGALAIKTMGNKEPIDPHDLFNFIKYVMK